MSGAISLSAISAASSIINGVRILNKSTKSSGGGPLPDTPGLDLAMNMGQVSSARSDNNQELENKQGPNRLITAVNRVVPGLLASEQQPMGDVASTSTPKNRLSRSKSTLDDLLRRNGQAGSILGDTMG